jgi:hypothetical protein
MGGSESMGQFVRRFFKFNATKCLVVGITTAVVQFYAALWFGVASETDFAIFHGTTSRFLDGLQMYSAASVDFTPPLFHALLLPLSRLDVRIAFTIWTAANVAVACFVLRQIIRAVPGAHTHRLVIAACVANAAGIQMTIRLGQVSWMVALLVTSAWLAARSSRWLSSGAWMGVGIAFKPFLLVGIPVFLVRRQWKALASCVFTVVACSLTSVLLFGWVAFSDWINNLCAVPDPVYATHFLNSSFVALVSRAHAPYFVGSALSGLTIVAVLWRARTADEDETWLLLLTAAILASPVGWVYYQPMLLGPAIALALSGRLTHVRWIAVGCFVPALSKTMFQHGNAIVALTLGSVYFWGLLFLYIQTLLRPRVAERLSLAQSAFDAEPMAA